MARTIQTKGSECWKLWVNLLSLMLILVQLCHTCNAAIPNQGSTASGPDRVTGENSTTVKTLQGYGTQKDNPVPATVAYKMTHHHSSVAIIGAAMGTLLSIFLIAWCIYAKQFPTSKSGQALIRIKYTIQKRQPELNAYHSVQNCPENSVPV
ncbi:uncharacterized protein [Amphiura filiformis]|uniref:uncharacterized protein n=1 Tax=Amphiura filiformis TaxID=82378 RepID=UPI003B2186E6